MTDNKFKDDSYLRTTTTTTNNILGVYDSIKENFTKAVNEMAKYQPQFLQSISNLQLDYTQSFKDAIQNTISAQKQFTSSWNIPVSAPYSEQFVKQANQITNNTIRAVNINNQLAINVLDAARENLKIYNRIIDA